MLGPDSTLLLIIVLAIAVAALAGVVVQRRLVTKIGCSVLAMLMSVTAGIVIVNDYYGYYQSWSQLSADLTGSYASYASTIAVSRTVGAVQHGQLRAVTFHGARSGINRPGFVYLPPQYDEPQFAKTRFPVVELIHGSPGSPTAWVVHLHLVSVMNRLLAAHEVGPMIVVMPTMSVGRHFEECVNAPGGAQDDTYLTFDVRSDVLADFRASSDPGQWGIGGLSSGGYCAVNVSLRHRGEFGAAAAMDGYFRPTDGPAARVLHHNPALEAANDPLLTASRLTSGVHPLPAFWLSAGTGDARDWAAAQAFVRVLHGLEQVTLYREPGAGHNFYAWAPALPHLLSWMWTQAAPPDLRMQFPIAGAVRTGVIMAPGANRHGPLRYFARLAPKVKVNPALPIRVSR